MNSLHMQFQSKQLLEHAATDVELLFKDSKGNSIPLSIIFSSSIMWPMAYIWPTA